MRGEKVFATKYSNKNLVTTLVIMSLFQVCSALYNFFSNFVILLSILQGLLLIVYKHYNKTHVLSKYTRTETSTDGVIQFS